MKKFATLTFLALAGALAGSASQITVNCTPFPVNFGSASGATGTATCTLSAGQIATLAVAGTVINQVQFSLFENWNGGDGVTNTTASASYTAAPVVAGVAGLGIITSTSCASTLLCSGPTSLTSSSAVANANGVAGGATINLSSTVNGVVGNNSAYVTEIITYTPPTSATPEPTTMLLLGSGLVACGFLRRRVR